MNEIVQYELVGEIAQITMDDGKANALSPEMIDAILAAFRRANEEANAVVLLGRPGRFCAGFDLRIMMAGPQAVTDLLIAGTKLLMDVYAFPKPVVVACTGHAIAGGALLLATGDTRIGVQGEFKIGLNEVSNGMPVPILAHRLAKDRLDPRAFVASVLQAKIYDPDAALVAGWLDAVAAPEALLDASIAEATRLAELPARAYAKTKASIRRESIEHIAATLEADLVSMTS
jgi:enoyl-CoA hydratase